jgi:hypothetical protein
MMPALAQLSGGIANARTDRYNASVMGNEQALAGQQGNAQAGLVARNAAQAFGKQTAAFGGAGVGYGGSSATALRQSAVNAELDVLNTKYKGQIAGYGYGVEDSLLKRQADQSILSGSLLAGGAALKALPSYSAPNPTPTYGPPS